jgi:SnoaL-like domain
MDHASFGKLLTRMTGAICAGDADGAAACFTPEGVYHDGFYGEFKGRAEIVRMLREFFYADARDFEWNVLDPVCDNSIGYARYAFSYFPTMPGAPAERVGFEGVSVCVLENGLIRHYSEIFERAPVLAKLGFPESRILKSVQRWAQK